MALNKEWHRLHRMPPGATKEERIKWHVAHARACCCREVPDSIKAEVGKLLKPRKR